MSLNPTSSHGGGGLPLTGGTLTGPLVIDMTAHADARGLRISAVPGGTAEPLYVEDGAGAELFAAQQNAGHAGGIYAASNDATLPAVLADGLGVTRPLFTAPLAPATQAFVSGAGARLSSIADVHTFTPVTFNPGAATTATCAIAVSPDNVTYTTVGTETEPAGVAFDGTIHVLQVYLPAAWYLRFTVNAQAVLGTTTYF